jgi:hypothetical protein
MTVLQFLYYKNGIFEQVSRGVIINIAVVSPMLNPGSFLVLGYCLGTSLKDTHQTGSTAPSPLPTKCSLSCRLSLSVDLEKLCKSE